MDRPGGPVHLPTAFVRNFDEFNGETVLFDAANETLLLAGIRRAADTRGYKKRAASPLGDMFMIILDSGMRRQEIVTMRIEWVD